jgi:hypothetical protein
MLAEERKQVSRRLAIGIAAGMLLACCTTVFADSILDIGVLVSWDRQSWNSDNYPGSVRATLLPDGTYNILFYGYVPGQWSALGSWSIDPDPFVVGMFSFTNQSVNTGTFQIVVDMPGVFLAGPTDMSGFATGIVLDRNGDGATLAAPPGGALYSAQIDGITQQTLGNAPASVSAGPFGAAAFGPESFTSVAGPAVTQSLAIAHNFSLTGGDSAMMLTTFVVTPEPATVLLSLLVVGSLLRRRRIRG